jgi:hypothetical protein
MSEETNEALEQIESEIKETQRKAGQEEDFEIEIVAEEESKAPEIEAGSEPSEDDDYGPKVQRRIKKLVDQRRKAETQAREHQEQTAQLQARLDRLERGTAQTAQNQANNDFQVRYDTTRKALAKAVEEGDTDAQLDFTEQIADMRAAVRVAEMQRAAPKPEPVRRAPPQAPPQAATPDKAMGWWKENDWFNSSGFERETAAARAIDVQLDLEGFDKNSDDYYSTLNNRLRNVFPELKLTEEPIKQRPKSRSPVAPTAGGSSSYKGNRIRLSNDQLRMARELGITDEASLKKYESEIKRQSRS